MIKAVVLDLDDTLCLTEAACFEMENEVLRNMKRDPMPRDIHLSTWGRPLFDVIQTRSPGIDVEDFRKAYAPVFKNYTESGKLDAIPERNIYALDELADMGKSLVVLTSRTHGELSHILHPSHDLASRMEAFYYRDVMDYHKPDPRAFSYIEKEHGWKPRECVYVGDSVTDAAAANGAGLSFIASLESGLRTRKDFSNYKVDSFINVFPEVVNAVKNLG